MVEKNKATLPFKTHKYPRFVILRKGKVIKICKRKTLKKGLDSYLA